MSRLPAEGARIVTGARALWDVVVAMYGDDPALRAAKAKGSKVLFIKGPGGKGVRLVRPGDHGSFLAIDLPGEITPLSGQPQGRYPAVSGADLVKAVNCLDRPDKDETCELVISPDGRRIGVVLNGSRVGCYSACVAFTDASGGRFKEYESLVHHSRRTLDLTQDQAIIMLELISALSWPAKPAELCVLGNSALVVGEIPHTS